MQVCWANTEPRRSTRPCQVVVRNQQLDLSGSKVPMSSGRNRSLSDTHPNGKKCHLLKSGLLKTSQVTNHVLRVIAHAIKQARCLCVHPVKAAEV